MMNQIFKNPRSSNDYRKDAIKMNSTPSGSYLVHVNLGYKYANPSDCGLLNQINSATMILKEISNPQGSNVCRKDSWVEYSTPSGSYLSPQYLGYKYANPSDCGLLNQINSATMILKEISNPRGSNIYRKNTEVMNSTPSGSHLVHMNLGYQHDNPSDCGLSVLLKEAIQ